MNLLMLAGTLSVAAALGATDAAMAEPAPRCFRTRDIENHTVGDVATLYLRVQRQVVFRVTMMNGCLAGASSSDPLVIGSFNPASEVCRPLDFDVGIRSGAGMTQRCIVSAITPLTAKDIEALPAKLRP